MAKIKELNVYTHGDSAQISTWSNVPYLFTTTLEKKGIKINRININPEKWREKIFNRGIWRVLRRLLGKDDFYQYIRTPFYQAEGDDKIRKACKLFPDADAHLFISMSFSAKHCTNKPSILFGDWTIAYHYDYFMEKQAGRLEHSAIRRQNDRMESADLVITLFPGIADYLKKYYKNKNIYYIGNVVNNINEDPADDLIEKKSSSQQILFIGSKRYLNGATQLIDTFIKFKGSHPQAELHIIGMTKADLGTNDNQIFAYGYLDKGDPTECEMYYKLISQAKVFVNTTDKWGAFSSMVEAMFFFTPVITTAYNEFVRTFGEKINFGYYTDKNPDSLYNLLSAVFDEKQKFAELCEAVHVTVENFTWDNYVNNFLSMVEELEFSQNQ